MLPIQRKISPYNHYSGNTVKYIILHYTGNRGDTAKNNADYFYGGNRGASAHYFVDPNSIWQVVEDYNGAWHIGNSVHSPTNRNSIGIEMCCQSNGEVSSQTEQNALELTLYLMKKYNVPISNVWTHYECTRGGENKICPNWSSNNWARWKNFKNKLSNGNVVEWEDQELSIPVNVKDYVIDEYYAQKNPDVVKVMGNSHKAFVDHYRQYGKKEGRKANALPDDFDAGQYLINNEDVNAAVNRGETTAAFHYIMWGWKEGRSYKKQPEKEVVKQGVKENKDETGELFYSVVAGSFKNKKEAEKQLDNLNKKGIAGGFLSAFYKK